MILLPGVMKTTRARNQCNILCLEFELSNIWSINLSLAAPELSAPTIRWKRVFQKCLVTGTVKMLSGPINASMYRSRSMIRMIKICTLRKCTAWMLLLLKCQNNQEDEEGCRALGSVISPCGAAASWVLAFILWQMSDFSSWSFNVKSLFLSLWIGWSHCPHPMDLFLRFRVIQAIPEIFRDRDDLWEVRHTLGFNYKMYEVY